MFAERLLQNGAKGNVCVIGTRQTDPVRVRDMIERFDVETAARVISRLAMSSVKPTQIDVIAEANVERYQAKLHSWRNEKNVVIVGGYRSNQMSEIVARLLLSRGSFTDATEAVMPSVALPFCFVWPETLTGSTSVMEPEKLEEISQADLAWVKSRQGYLFAMRSHGGGWNVNRIELAEPENRFSYDFGVLLGRCVGLHSINMTIIGASGPGTLGVGQWIQEESSDQQVPGADKGKVAFVVVKSTVRWQSDFGLADRRNVIGVEAIASGQIEV